MDRLSLSTGGISPRFQHQARQALNGSQLNGSHSGCGAQFYALPVSRPHDGKRSLPLALSDTVRFGTGSGKPPQAAAVEQLDIPYAFRVYRREKKNPPDRASGVVGLNDCPRTVRPENLASHIRGAQLVALGDLHGSYQKLVEVLLATGLATLHPDSAKRFKEYSEAFVQDILTEPTFGVQDNPYRRFVLARIQGKTPQESLRTLRRYGFSDETLNEIVQRQYRYQKQYKQLRALIRQLQWAGQPGQQLLLIGDVLSDRGPLDFLTLDVIDRIRAQNPERLMTLASNHDHAGMQTLMYRIFPLGWSAAASLGRSMMMASEGKPQVTVTLQPQGERVHLSLKPGWNAGSRPDLMARYKRFVETSQLVHYRPQTQTLFTHAPINTMEISRLNDVLLRGALPCIPAPQTDSQSASASLRDVNVWQAWANRFWQSYISQSIAENSLNNTVEDVLERGQGTHGFLWSRDSLQDFRRLPFYNAGVQALVHGHDRGSDTSLFSLRRQYHPMGQGQAFVPEFFYTIFNLDQDTRKTLLTQESSPSCTLYVEF